MYGQSESRAFVGAGAQIAALDITAALAEKEGQSAFRGRCGQRRGLHSDPGTDHQGMREQGALDRDDPLVPLRVFRWRNANLDIAIKSVEKCK